MMKKYIHGLYAGLLLLAASACTENSPIGDEDRFVLSYKVTLANDAQSRAIGDGTTVDELLVGVFEDGKSEGTNFPFTVKDGKANVEIPMFKDRTYNLVFWAHKEGNRVYQTDDLSNITIDYSQINNMSLADAAALDAFSGTRTGITFESNEATSITLTRPFSMLSIGAKGSNLEEISTASVTLDKVYTSYQPLTNTIGNAYTENVTLTLTGFGEESFNIGEDDYTYLVTTFLLVPEGHSVTLSATFKDESDNEVSRIEETSVELTTNHRTHVGTSLTEGWDGTKIETLPEADDDGVIHIDNAATLVYLLENGHTSETTQKFHLCKDLDMKGTIERNADYALKNVEFDGGGFTLYNLSLPLFGESEGLTVKDLTLNKSAVSDLAINGALATVVKGTSSFHNIKVVNSEVTAQQKAGGLVGYIRRIAETDRSETMTVTFSDCSVSGTSVSAEVAGKLVGELGGYDNAEKLTFTGCTATEVTTGDYASPYVEGNEGAWLADTDYSAFDGFLGDETYCRGTVMYEESRFVPKWDGSRTVEPLLANTTYDGSDVTAGSNKYVVYSPFDLAGIRKKTASPAAVYLKENVDMCGQGADGKYNVPSCFTQSAYVSDDDNNFDPFNYITTLDGLNHTIYNLCISQPEKTIAAFILYASGTTVHRNITFKNACTVSTHKEVETDAKAYGAILVSNVDATYTMENVHAYDCKVFALQKVGTLAARVSGTSTLKNNSVNNCYVENYVCNISERFESGSKTVEIGSTSVTIDNVYADFYPYGEVGGMYGFIQGNSTLADCKVNGTTVYAYGQDDKEATIAASGLKGNIVKAVVKTAGYYLVPGRHVSTFIGNIRATGKVTITGCTVDANTQCTNRHDKHNDTYTSIGQAYIVKFVDSEGTVTVDGNKLTLADCNRNTKR